MKVGVVTVYNSLNPGSFLQATSLYKAIEELGYDSYFYDTGIRSIRKQTFIECMYLLKNRKLKYISDKIQLCKIYEEILSDYNVQKKNESADVMILGSDEIWNLERENMTYGCLWGQGFDQSRCISFAPSLNNATEDMLKKHKFVADALEKLFAISVRDKHSCEELSKLTQREIREVCDPTVLVYPEAYVGIANKCTYENYVLVYMYAGSMSPEEIQSVIDFARKYNKKLIAFGASHTWCDINVNGSPQDFLMYIKNADFICTTTFHGTMLSMIYGKDFACIGKKNKKVQQLLESYDMDRQATADTLEEVLLREYDKRELDEKLLQKKKEGLSFLEANLKKIANS